MTQFFPMLYETLFGITSLYILTKLLGKTQISQLTAFDFIAAIVLGELVGNALFNEEAGIREMAFAVVLWGLLLFIIEIITQKFKGSRYLLEGKPTMIIHQGNLIYEEMRKNKIDINEVQHLLRSKDVFSIQEVEYAILETNGEISVLKKAPYQTPTKADLNLPQTKPQIAVTLIMDGEIIYDNLREINASEQWLYKELNRQGYQDVKEIFYAEYLEGKKLHVQPYKKIKHTDYERKLNK